MMVSSSIPYGQTVEVYTNYNTIVVGLMKDWRFRANILSFVITLITVPKSMRLLEIGILLMIKLTIRISRSRYLVLIELLNMRPTSFLTTLILGDYLFLLPSFFMQVYLMNSFHMGT